jgi:hypothetical protein
VDVKPFHFLESSDRKKLCAQPRSCPARGRAGLQPGAAALPDQTERFVKFKPQTPLREIIRLTAG